MTTTITCPKCNGSKKLHRYSHIADGDCFECGATGVVTVRASKASLHETADLPSPESALVQLRCLYRSAQEYGAEWFGTTDCGWNGWGMVRFYAGFVSASKAAQAIAAFEALEALEAA